MRRQNWACAGLLPAAAGQALQRAGGSWVGIGAGSRTTVEGVRSVGSVHRGKIMGNVIEAWESRAVEEVQETREPANFDDFRVSSPPWFASLEMDMLFVLFALGSPPAIAGCVRGK